MKALLPRSSVIFVLVAVFASSAQAEYRCDPAPSWVDRAACKAAGEGARELRRFVEAMNSIRINIRFDDYVNMATAQSWEQKSRTAAVRPSEESTTLAKAETR
jgi:hypothetical protein